MGEGGGGEKRVGEMGSRNLSLYFSTCFLFALLERTLRRVTTDGILMRPLPLGSYRRKRATLAENYSTKNDKRQE